METDNSLTGFADRELRATGYAPDAEEPANWIYDNVIELVKTFGKQGHSGSSAALVRAILLKLLDYQPLGPLTGEDSEWMEVGEGEWQNKRCYHVFKNANGACDLNGKVFREPNGVCYTSYASRVPVTFPYTPTTEYVDVPFQKED